jgi:hypothetical protein
MEEPNPKGTVMEDTTKTVTKIVAVEMVKATAKTVVMYCLIGALSAMAADSIRGAKVFNQTTTTV